MPALRTALALLLVCIASLRARADVVNCGASIPPGVICLAGNVSDTAGGGPLVSGQIYHLSICSVPAGQTLTIEPGAILKFHPGAYLTVGGQLNSNGAIFTAVSDDTAGGDTNGDNPEVVPTRGAWDGIAFQTTSDFSIFSGADVRYAEVGLSLNGASIFVTNSTITECSLYAVDFSGNSYPIFANVSMTNNRFAMTGVPLGAIPIFAQVTASGNDLGDCILVTEGDLVMPFNTIGPANMPNGSEALVVCTSITVDDGETLTFQPGLIVKFGSPPFIQQGCSFRNVNVAGNLHANGVAFTSLFDDTTGGDTNKDGNFTQPAPEDWGAFLFGATSDASVMQNCAVRYGGDATPTGTAPLIHLTGADITLENVHCEHGGGAGMSLTTSSFPTVSNCSFNYNAGVAVERVHPAAVAGFTNNSASGNAIDAIRMSSGIGVMIVSASAAIERENSLNEDGVFVVADDLRVDPGAVFTLEEGVVFKWTTPANHRLIVHGTLTVDGEVGSEVVFTTDTDDSIVGDTNKDGGASQPSPGDWDGIEFTPGSDASSIDRARLRYAGNAALVAAAITMSATSPTMTFSTVERSESACLSLLNTASFPQISDCAFDDSDRAVIGVSIRALEGFSNNTASGNANGNRLVVSRGDVSFGFSGLMPGSALTIGPSSAIPPGAGVVFASDIDVPTGFKLVVEPGFIAQFAGVYEVDVDGTITAGGIGDPVVFTSLDDGAPGDWRQIHVSEDGSYFENVVIRYAGAAAAAALLVVSSSAQVKDVRIEDCGGAALAIPGSLPLVDGCEFNRCARAVNQASVRALPGFSNNSAEDNPLGDYIRVTDGNVTADVLVAQSQSPNGIPFVFATNIRVFAGMTLTVDPGVTFKFDGARRFDVDGVLSTNAAPDSIVLTSLVDDIAGDTNKDMGASSPAPGDWYGLAFTPTSDASIAAGVRIRHAGAFGGPSVSLTSADILLLDSAIERSGGAGLSLSTNSFPEVRGCRFVDCVGLPIVSAPIGALQGFLDNTATGNTPGDYIRVTSSTFTSPLIVSRFNSLNSNGVFGVAATLSVGPGQSMTLRQGVIFKWDGNRSLNVSGTLVVEGAGFEPVVFTSIRDDSIGGDTQKDGSATTPMPGDWGHVAMNTTGGGSALEHMVARYGGSNTAFASIQILDSTTTARALLAEHSARDGIRVTQLSGDAENWVAVNNGGDGVDMGSSPTSFDVVHATVANNAGIGVRKGASSASKLVNSIAFGNAGGELSGFAPGQVLFSNAGAGFAGFDGNIDANPLFANPAAGDWSLAPLSPCVDAANKARALPVVTDHREASRILDHDLDRVALPDMGAFELGAFRLAVGGDPRVGSTMTFTVNGTAAGRAIFFLGVLDGAKFRDPIGFQLYGSTMLGVVLGARPVGSTLAVQMPQSPARVDERFGVQALVRSIPGMLPRSATFTERYRGRLVQ